MVNMLSVLAGIAGLASAAAVTYYLLKELIPLFEEVINDYIEDEEVAMLLANFAILYIGLEGASEIASGLHSMDIYIISGIGRILETAAGSALNVFGELKWFIYIGALLFIGYNLSKMRED